MRVLPHWKHLLVYADELHKGAHYGLAVIVAQAACEVIIARAMTKAVAEQLGHDDLRKQYRLISFSPEGKKVRTTYNNLTGDSLDAQGFWSAYQVNVGCRHTAVHTGDAIPGDAARSFLDAANLLVAHVAQHNGLKMH
jgi:hypothetical protein